MSAVASRPSGPHAILGAFDAMESAAIVVHQERCAKVRNRNVTCLKCAEACTSGCIALVDGELVVDASKCVGCGTCATVCPTCALETRNPTDAELAAACAAARCGGEVVIACEPALAALDGLVRPDAVASVVCAGRVDESLLAGLAAQGVSHVRVLCGSCESCAQRHGRATAELVAETCERVLAAWGAQLAVDVGERVPEAVLADGVAPDDAAAAFAEHFAQPRGNEPIAPEKSRVNGTDAARRAAPLRVMRDGTLPHFVPDRRERLLDALADLGEPQAEKLDCRLWGTVVIDGSKCTSCRMCATFCPTGAIVKFDEADGRMGVKHFPADCVKCGSCRDICPADAIVLRDQVKPAALANGECHRYSMAPRPVSVRNNPHQILDTMRQTFNGDLFER